MEEIITEHLPGMGEQEIQRAAEFLADGVKSVYDDINEQVDNEWVKKRLNKDMLNLSNKERVIFLSNLIAAERAAYPDMTLGDDVLARIKDLREAEDNTASDVDELLAFAGSALKYHAGLLKRQSVIAMEKRLYELDHETVESEILAGMENSLAYAGACYIMQQCGELVVVNGEDASEMHPQMLGTAAAVSVESSKLMELYSAGKISMKVLQQKIESMLTAALTFVCSHAVTVLAVATQSAAGFGLFIGLLSLMTDWLYLHPVLVILSASAVSIFSVTKLVTTKDIENVYLGIWETAKVLWAVCRGLWDKLTGKVLREDDLDAEYVDITEENDVDEEDEECLEEEEEQDADINL